MTHSRHAVAALHPTARLMPIKLGGGQAHHERTSMPRAASMETIFHERAGSKLHPALAMVQTNQHTSANGHFARRQKASFGRGPRVTMSACHTTETPTSIVPTVIAPWDHGSPQTMVSQPNWARRATGLLTG